MSDWCACRGTSSAQTPIDIVPEEFSELAQRRGVLFVIPQRAFKFDPAHDVLYGSIAAAVGECTFILLRDGRFPWATQQVETIGLPRHFEIVGSTRRNTS